MADVESHEDDTKCESVCASLLQDELDKLERHQLLLVQLAKKAKRIQKQIEKCKQNEEDSQWSILVFRYELQLEQSAPQETMSKQAAEWKTFCDGKQFNKNQVSPNEKL